MDVFGIKLLVTAAHVVDDAAITTLYWHDGKQLVPLEGRFDTSQLPRSGKRDDDKIDLAVLEIGPEMTKALARVHLFLPFCFLNPLDRIFPDRHYTFAGFPASYSATHIKLKKVTARRWIYTSPTVGTTLYKKLCYDPSQNIVVDFSKTQCRRETGATVQAPRPNGISGGPVFSVEVHPAQPKIGINLRLAGIATDYFEESEVMVASRIGFVLEIVRTRHPHLSWVLPKRPDVDITVTVSN